MSLFASGNQTVGPYLHIGLNWLVTRDIAGKGVKGERVTIAGRLIDGDGAGVNDGLIEIWQANAAGRYAHPEDNRADIALDPYFLGFGRCALDQSGGFRFRTVQPGRVPGPGNTLQAPHIALGIAGPGFLKRLATRIYFADCRAENAEDPILGFVPEERRSTLLAVQEPGQENLYRFDIRLSGERETVFFDI